MLEVKQSFGGVKKPDNIRNLLAISSGKGGVGKTTITLQLALDLHRRGIRVGILDVDIYGPNITAFMDSKREKSSTLDPVYYEGIPLKSMSMLVNPDQALMWRGPMISKAAMQLAQSASWPELDILLVDFPPGTGDIHLSMLSQMAWVGYVLVTTPHIMARDEALRVKKLFEHYEIPLLQTLANLHHVDCSSCGHRMHLLGHEDHGLPLGYHEAWMRGRLSNVGDYDWVDKILTTIQDLAAIEVSARKSINIPIKEIK